MSEDFEPLRNELARLRQRVADLETVPRAKPEPTPTPASRLMQMITRGVDCRPQLSLITQGLMDGLLSDCPECQGVGQVDARGGIVTGRWCSHCDGWTVIATPEADGA